MLDKVTFTVGDKVCEKLFSENKKDAITNIAKNK